MEYKWTALTVVTVGTVMAGIDGRILIIGLPTIAQQLHADPEEVIWITQAYLLASTACLLFIGRIADQFGRVKLYNLGFVIFTVGSLLSAISSSPLEVIGCRIIQGVGSGILVTNSSVIVTDASPRKELGAMLGFNQMAFRIGNMSGLTLSGVILAVVDWRGLFYVNIPIGIFGTLWAHRRLKEIAQKDTTKKIDWYGFGFFSLGFTFVLLGITFLSYGLASYLEGISLLLVGGVMLFLFAKKESSISYPLLDLKLFGIRLFAMGNIAQFLNSLCWGGIVILLAFYLQIGLGYSPLGAGLGILPMEFSYFLFTFLGGRMSDRYGSRMLTSLGLTVLAGSLGIMSTFGGGTQYPEVASVLCLFGIGNGFFTSPNLKAIMGSVPSNRLGVASGFRNTMFQTGVTVSYGLVIFLLTLGIPYSSFSDLLQGIAQGPALILARSEFFNGFRLACIILAIVDAVAIVPSVMRGNSEITREVKRTADGPEGI